MVFRVFVGGLVLLAMVGRHVMATECVDPAPSMSLPLPDGFALPPTEQSAVAYNALTGDLWFASNGSINFSIVSRSALFTPLPAGTTSPIGLLTNNRFRVGITALSRIMLPDGCYVGNVGSGIPIDDLSFQFFDRHPGRNDSFSTTPGSSAYYIMPEPAGQYAGLFALCFALRRVRLHRVARSVQRGS